MVLFLALISTAFIYAQEPGADPQVTAERSEDAARQITEVKTGRKAACAFFSLDELKKKAADDKKIFFNALVNYPAPDSNLLKARDEYLKRLKE